jgi:hypothetical protein
MDITLPRIRATVYIITLVAKLLDIKNTTLNNSRVDLLYLCSSNSYTLTTPDLNIGGIKNTIKNNIAKGTPNSYVNHIIPPPSLSPTNAGAEIKLIADNCVAAVLIDNGNHPKLLPPRK